MAVYSPIIAARFWSKVDVGRDNTCWEWRGGKSKGYGSFKINGSAVQAPRVAWELASGSKMATELFACHDCDNPGCCNPAHIYAGTRSDNARDAVERGQLRIRDQKGEGNGNAKLTEEQVRQIKGRIAAGHYNTHIARDFGVTHQMISKIRTGRFWGWV